MGEAITISWWLILLLCVMYSTGSVFTAYIFEKTFENDKYVRYVGLFLIGSYLWPIGLIGYIIWGIIGIIKDFS